MEGHLFHTPAVAGELERFIEARLFTDRAYKPERMEEHAALQKKLVGKVALPSFVVIDPRTGEKVNGGFDGMTLKEEVFNGFLRKFPGRPNGS
jgi:hypothetical protein